MEGSWAGQFAASLYGVLVVSRQAEVPEEVIEIKEGLEVFRSISDFVLEDFNVFHFLVGLLFLVFFFLPQMRYSVSYSVPCLFTYGNTTPILLVLSR